MNSLSCLCLTPPGAKQFTLIFGARCVARNFVRFITPAFETEYPICLCAPLYKSGLAEVIPVVAEKFTMVPFLLFLANSLHTEKRAVKLISKKSEIDSRDISKSVCFLRLLSI